MNVPLKVLERVQSADQTNRVAESRKLRIASESASIFLGQVLCLGFGVLNNFVIAWLLGPQGKGLIYLVQFVASSAVIFLNLGLGPSAVYHLGRDRTSTENGVARVLFWPSLLLGLVPLLFLAALWPQVGHLVSAKLSTRYLFISLAAVPGMVLTWNAGFLNLAKGRIFSYNLLRIAPPALLFMGIILTLPFSHYRNERWVATAWLAGVSATSIYAALSMRAGAFLNTGRDVSLRSAFRFGWSSHLGAVTQYLQHRVDMVLVSALLPIADLGIYSVAVVGSELLWYVPHTVATVLMPHVACSSDEEANRMTSGFCRVIVLLNAVLAITLAVLGTLFLRSCLPAFRSAILPLWLLLPGTIAASVFKVLSSDFNGRGRPFETFRPAAVSLLVCVSLGILLVPRLGINGAALVTSVGYILNSCLYLRAYWRVTSVPPSSLLFARRNDLYSLTSAAKSLFIRIMLECRVSQS